jgi:sugar phosphate isomerase/epimerase
MNLSAERERRTKLEIRKGKSVKKGRPTLMDYGTNNQQKDTNAMDWELSYYTSAIPYRKGRHVFDEKEIQKNWKNIRDAGIGWVGFHGVNLFEKSEADFRVVVPKISDMLHEFGFKLSSLHFGGPAYSASDKGQGLVRKKMLEFVETFKPWKPKSLVMHAGWVLGPDSGHDRAIEEYKRLVAARGFDAVMDTVAGNLKLMGKEAAKHGINLAIENMGRFVPIGQKDSLPMLIKMIDEPNVGYCLDSGHAHACGESVTDWIKIMGDKLFETHFHDNRGRAAGSKEEFLSSAGIDEHLAPGFGTIPWIDVIQALRRGAYPGPITFETDGWPVDDPLEGYRLAIEWWRTCEHIAADLENKHV